MKLRRALLLGLCLGVLLPAASVAAQQQAPGRFHLSADTLAERERADSLLPYDPNLWPRRVVDLTAGEWRFRLDDDPAWAAPELDDSGWAALSPDALIGDTLIAAARAVERAGGPGIGWFRLRLTVDPALRGRPLALSLFPHGAVELYLDGELLYRGGEVEERGDRAGVRRPVLPLPIVLPEAEHTLAVRYNIASAADMLPVDDFFHLGVQPASAIARTAVGLAAESIVVTRFAGILGALGFLHLLLFLLLRRPVGNLFFAGFALLLALQLTLNMTWLQWGEDVRVLTFFSRIGMPALSLLGMLSLVAFLHTTFYGRLRRYLAVLLGLGVLALILELLWPTTAFPPALGVLVLLALEGIRTLAVAIWRRHDGAWILGVGFAIALGTAIYGTVGLAAGLPQIHFRATHILFLGIPLSASIYLARNMARTSKGYERLSRHLEQEVAERTRELEEARRAAESANETKSVFLANVSHELRTPLNAIIGYSEMLQEEAEEEGQPEIVPDLEKIHGAGKHLLGLINDLLDLSKIEAGKMELHLERFAVEPLLREVAATVQPLVEQKGSALELHFGDLGEAHDDQTKLRQILLNLLSNACKFTENGTITVVAARAGEWLTFRVSDTGIGMTTAQMEKLFRPFQQADSSTASRYGGTGLGLTISKHFAEMMGGSIAVASEPGVGSTFTVRLPVEVNAARTPPPASREAATQPAAHSPAPLAEKEPAAPISTPAA